MRPNKILKSTGKGPVYLRITKDRKTFYISTGHYLHTDEWDEKKQKVEKKHPNSVRMNKIFADKISELQANALRFEDHKLPFTAKDLKEAFSGGGKEDFIKYAATVIERRLESDSDDEVPERG